MGYCFMTMGKIKTIGTMTSVYKHNYRVAEVSNADPSLQHLNDEIVKLGKNPDGSDKTYVDAFDERMGSLPYYETHSRRKNAVLAYEVVTTYSRNDDIDVEQWKKKNVEWLKKTFDVTPDGKSNVISVVFHADEPGNVHCHAIVIPIDERGRLNASRFTDGARAMSNLQTDYAKDMEEFGLQRGLEGSSASHKDIRKFYADLNRAMDVPKAKENETGEQFRERMLDSIQELQAAAMRERYEGETLQKRKITEWMNKAKQEVREERESLLGSLNISKERLEKINADLDRNEELIRKGMQYEEFLQKVEELKERDPEAAAELQELLDELNSPEEQNISGKQRAR